MAKTSEMCSKIMPVTMLGNTGSLLNLRGPLQGSNVWKNGEGSCLP